MVLEERSCWRSGECRRGWASRSRSGRAGAAASGPGEPTAGAGAVAAGSGPSIEVAISAVRCSGCCCDLIAYSLLLVLLGSLLSLYASDFFTASQVIFLAGYTAEWAADFSSFSFCPATERNHQGEGQQCHPGEDAAQPQHQEHRGPGRPPQGHAGSTHQTASPCPPIVCD